MATPWDMFLGGQGIPQYPGTQNSLSDFGGFGQPRGVSMSGLGQQLQGYQPSPQAGNPYSGGSTSLGAMAQAQPMGGQGQGGGMPFSLPAGGLYGSQKWDGTNDVDLFLRRGTPIRANMGGQVLQAVPGNGLQGQGYVVVKFDNGLYATFVHTQPATQGRFAAGATIGTVGDPSLDILRWPGGQYGQPQDGYQHTDIRLSMRSPVSGGPGAQGEINASQYLTQNGYQGQRVARTPGPPQGMGGGGGFGGGGFPGMPGGGGPFGMMGGGGFPGGGGGFPGAGGGFPGMPGGGGMFPGGGGGFPGGGGGFPGGFGGGSPFGGGGMQFPQMPMMPSMMSMGQFGGGARPPQMGFPMPMGGGGGGSMLGSMMGQLPFGGMSGIGPMSMGLGGFGGR